MNPAQLSSLLNHIPSKSYISIDLADQRQTVNNLISFMSNF